MPALNFPVTHKMAGGPVGDLIDLGRYARGLKITARAECWVRALPLATDATAPTAPAATPAPAAGAETSGWAHLFANDVLPLPPEPYGQKAYRYVEVWEIAAGELVIGEAPVIDPGAAKTPAQLVTDTAAASTDKLKYYAVTGRNGAGSLSLSGGAVAAVSTDTLVNVLNLTDGGSIKAGFTSVTTGGLTQTSDTDYSAKKLLVILRAA